MEGNAEMIGGLLELLGVGFRGDSIDACQRIMQLVLDLLVLEPVGVFQAAQGHLQGLVGLSLLQERPRIVVEGVERQVGFPEQFFEARMFQEVREVVCPPRRGASCKAACRAK